MATSIENKATLNFTSGNETLHISSNTATVLLEGPLELEKRVLENGYVIDGELTYELLVKNTSASALSNVTIVDNLGTYELANTTKVTPLAYVGPAHLYQNGSFVSILTPTTIATDAVTFSFTSLPGNTSSLIVYKVKVTEYAIPTGEGASITNTATVAADEITEIVEAKATIPAAAYADIRITKSMHPNPVFDGSSLTYQFDIENRGPSAAVDVSLVDTFTPAPTITTVTVDGTVTTDYTYGADHIFHYPATTSTNQYTIPAATFTQDPTTGVVSYVPTTSVITILGTI